MVNPHEIIVRVLFLEGVDLQPRCHSERREESVFYGLPRLRLAMTTLFYNSGVILSASEESASFVFLAIAGGCGHYGLPRLRLAMTSLY